MDVDQVVEAEGPAVADGHLHHRELQAPAPQLVVGVAEGAQPLDPGLLQPRQVGGVVDHPHGVGLGEAGPQPVAEAVGGGVGGGLEGGAHLPSLTAGAAAPSPGGPAPWDKIGAWRPTTDRPLRRRPPPEARPHGAGSDPVRAPTSFTQRSSLLMSAFNPSREFMSWVYQLNGKLDVDALAKAIDDVVHRHDMLRVRFEGGPDGPEQVVTPFQST